jgi:hypothetical protein
MVKGSFNNRSSLDLVPGGVSPRGDRPLVNPRGSPQRVNLVPGGGSPRRDRPLVNSRGLVSLPSWVMIVMNIHSDYW